MDTTISDDFRDFINENDLFNSDVVLYDSQGGTIVFEGRGVYDRKPNLIENDNGQLVYQGHKSILTLSMSELTFMPAYFSLKSYFVEITDNVDLKSYLIENSNYNSTVNAVYCELKLA